MIVGALLARNEAAPDRYLERCVTNALSLCDLVVALDDGSTDDTRARLASLGCVVVERASSGFWGADETSARAQLWHEASLRGDWVYVFDADHELLGATRDDFRVLCSAQHIDGWAFPLLDCWDSPDTHRTDGWWQAWRLPRVWLARALRDAKWPTGRDIHAGHLPANWDGVVTQAPLPMILRHWGYVNPAHRARKVKQYLDLGPRP